MLNPTADAIKCGDLGNIFFVTGVELTNKLQKMAVEETRLGIPMLFGFDIIHGHRTTFPIPIATAASWDLDLIESANAWRQRNPIPRVSTGFMRPW